MNEVTSVLSAPRSFVRRFLFLALPALVLSACGTESEDAPPFILRVGGDAYVTMPLKAELQAEVIALREVNGVTVEWTARSGPGAVQFDAVTGMKTWASFTASGAYEVEAIASAEGYRATQTYAVTVLESGQEPVTEFAPVGSGSTGFDDAGQPLTLPSINPAGVAFHPSTGGLLIVDSEINEVPDAFAAAGGNMFHASPVLDELWEVWDLGAVDSSPYPPNTEPTGITYCAADGYVYVTNDDTNGAYRYALDGGAITFHDFGSTQPISADPDGITCDPVTGELYVVAARDMRVLVYRYDEGFRYRRTIDLFESAGDPGGIPTAPEGIAFDPVNRHLFVVSDPDLAIFEYTLSGEFVARYDLDEFGISGIDPQGLTIGSSSDGGDGLSLYLVDGGVDNDTDPDQRDGYVYELEIVRTGG